MTIEPSEEEYVEHADGFDGVCLACGTWTCGGVEPDAHDDACDACGESRVCGAEEAMMMGHLWIVDDGGSERDYGGGSARPGEIDEPYG